MFRLAEGGSAEKYALNPDLTALGKFLGGGTPMGAVAGRRKFMDILDPSRPGVVFHGGSFNGNVVSSAAGLVAIRALTAEAIRQMDAQAARLLQALREKSASLCLDVSLTAEGSVGGISFAKDQIRHEDNPSALGLSALFHLACLNEGVALGPGGLFAMATMINEMALDHAVSGMSAALEAVAKLQA
jgi:glutamate-1-semialdehyde 2,1-aminomutase